MKFKHLLFLSLLTFQVRLYSQSIETFNIQTPSKENSSLEIVIRLPSGYSRETAEKFGILALFGGKNWGGRRTIETYRLNEFSDKHGLFIISPSFKNDEYWHPENWSGKALMDAFDMVYGKYGLDRKKKVFYYGYSAGAQCVNLFLAWKPEIVEAWGLHDCGVWFDPEKNREVKVSGLATCGELDAGRYELSVSRIGKIRENGCPVIWKSFPDEGHSLPDSAIKFAEAFFESHIVSPDKKVKFAGDDQLMRYFPSDSKELDFIDPENRNEFYDEKLAKLWTGK